MMISGLHERIKDGLVCSRVTKVSELIWVPCAYFTSICREAFVTLTTASVAVELCARFCSTRSGDMRFPRSIFDSLSRKYDVALDVVKETGDIFTHCSGYVFC